MCLVLSVLIIADIFAVYCRSSCINMKIGKLLVNSNVFLEMLLSFLKLVSSILFLFKFSLLPHELNS